MLKMCTTACTTTGLQLWCWSFRDFGAFPSSETHVPVFQHSLLHNFRFGLRVVFLERYRMVQSHQAILHQKRRQRGKWLLPELPLLHPLDADISLLLQHQLLLLQLLRPGKRRRLFLDLPDRQLLLPLIETNPVHQQEIIHLQLKLISR